MLEAYLAIIVIIVIFLYSALKVVKEYERLVVFRLGRLIGARGPGLVILIPIIDRYSRVSLRIFTHDVPSQEVITRDNVTSNVNAVVYTRVVDPVNAIVNVENFTMATSQLSQTTLRSVAGQAELDELLSERDKLNLKIQQILDEATNPWGIKVTAVEIKDVFIPEGLQRAISRQASAERERRAIVIQAQGEMQAAQKLSEAASTLGRVPGGLFMRLLRTLPEIAGQPGNIIAFPLPMELRYLSEALDLYIDDKGKGKTSSIMPEVEEGGTPLEGEGPPPAEEEDLPGEGEEGKTE